MGGFFGKKKQDKAPAPSRPASGRSPAGPGKSDTGSQRKSVRRVVPGAGKGGVTAAVRREPAAAKPAEDVIDLPDMVAAPAVAETPAALAAPAVVAPKFAGSLQAAEPQGPSRTGDQALLDFLTGAAPSGDQKVELITPEQAAAARTKAESENLPLDVALVQLGFVTEEALVNALSQATFVPHLKVDKYEIRKKALDTISRADAERYGVFPVDKLGNLLTLAMVNPLDTEALRHLEGKTGLDIKKVVATRTEIATAIDKYYGGKVAASEQSRAFSQDLPDVAPVQDPGLLDIPSLDATPASEPAPAPAASVPTPAASTAVTPEIQDLDDLLGGEEVAPAIIEPVTITPEPAADAAHEVPIAAPAESEHAFVDAPMAGTGALQRAEAGQATGPAPVTAGDGLDLDLDLGPPAPITAPVPSAEAPSRPASAPTAAEGLDLDLGPVAPAPSPAPAASAAGIATTPAARPAAPAAPSRPAAARFVDLVPVSEDEFRAAVRHGKARPFERWLGLQTRPRIVNAVPVERELDPLLAGLYATAQRVA